MSDKNAAYLPYRPQGIMELELDVLHAADDFTYYLTEAEFIAGRLLKPDEKDHTYTPRKGKTDSPFSIECEIKLNKKNADPKITLEGRANLTRCFDGKHWALTVRRTKKIEKGYETLFDPLPTDRNPDLSVGSCNGWHTDGTGRNKEMGFLFGIQDVCQHLNRLLRHPEPPESGLIVVSGSTNCSKSLVVRELMTGLLQGKKTKNRRHHVITLEDPPEKYLSGAPDCSDKIKQCQAQGVDYTVRFLGEGKDCPSLEAALQDARRQTPALFYYGEVRNPKDWGPILDFAGSGHLIVTTTHAGSLVESLQHIAKAVGADTPAEIGDMASRIAASIHLSKLTCEEGGVDWTGVVPALWRRTPASVAQLVADGFSSVLPHFPAEEKNCGSFGRFWFANKLTITNPEFLEQALQSDINSR